MIYADTDFFLALIKKDDWLKKNAEALLLKFRGKITTSIMTIAEALIVANRFAIEPELIVSSIVQIANITDEDENTALLAAHYIENYNFTVFDAFQAALCGNKYMLSSDKAFDKLKMKIIALEQKH